MSLKRVLEVARKLGIPVIVTDEAGAAAQAVMPFDDFAALVDTTSPAPRSASASHKPRVSRETSSEHDEIAQALADLTVERMADPPAVRAGRGTDVRENEQSFLEDRFYLEPLDDGEEMLR